MRKASIGTTLVAALAVAGTVWYAEGAAQDRKPNEPATGHQAAQPQQPPQAMPRDGQKPAPDSPPNQAVPRPPDTRRDPDRPRRGPERGPVVVPYPGWPSDVRFDVTPNDAAVYADGFYVGIVDDAGQTMTYRTSLKKLN